jgi:hypothetical protein
LAFSADNDDDAVVAVCLLLSSLPARPSSSLYASFRDKSTARRAVLAMISVRTLLLSDAEISDRGTYVDPAFDFVSSCTSDEGTTPAPG